MEPNKFLQKAKSDNQNAAEEALNKQLEAERLGMIEAYKNKKSQTTTLSIVCSVLFVLCFICFCCCDKYTKSSFLFWEWEAVSLSYTFSILFMIIFGISIVGCVISIFSSNESIQELENSTPKQFQNNKNKYIFDTKGLLGLLFKK